MHNAHIRTSRYGAARGIMHMHSPSYADYVILLLYLIINTCIINNMQLLTESATNYTGQPTTLQFRAHPVMALTNSSSPLACIIFFNSLFLSQRCCLFLPTFAQMPLRNCSLITGILSLLTSPWEFRPSQLLE